LAAGVPAVLWAISYPLPTAVVVVVAAAAVLGVRTLRARAAILSPTHLTDRRGRPD
jgi:hypothetical protein